MFEDLILLDTVYAAILAPLGITIAYYFWRILRNFKNHRDISMTMFFLNQDAPKVFRVICVTVFLYAIALLLRLLVTLEAPVNIPYEYFDYASKTTSILALFATIYFQRRMLYLTMKPSDRHARS